ncbi:hypothetical protein DPMN_181440 [Dreissena polymorpha]|uniref:Uncharacterized protein n=1 Tax=Dreissena polymorpha TaxID=45954 RepID=A0A9D4DG94_DREPO|nr:hypothetical protein DPMN_181440 [Dreissena polymorpha]
MASLFQRIITPLVVVVVLCSGLAEGQSSIEIQQHFELENVLRDDQQEYWVWRSEAYNQKTLRLEDMNRAHTIELRLCIEPFNPNQKVLIVVSDILYSNDGPSDIVYLKINGHTIGNFTTVEQWRSGYEWNVFRNSKVIGPSMLVQKGHYLLAIEVETDKWGVELDRIQINAENHDPTKRMFCGAALKKKTS